MMKTIMTNRRNPARTPLGTLIAILVSIAAPAAAGTIDFETPPLGGADELYMNVYQAEGSRSPHLHTVTC